MTRRHFIVIAEILKEFNKKYGDKNGEVSFLASKFSDFLRQENMNFDDSKFRSAIWKD